MALNEDELKYSNVINSLKQLSHIKAPENFELELMRKINSEKYTEKKRSYLERIFIPGRLIPSAGLAIAAVILFFVMNTNSDEFENPLLIKPRLREEASSISFPHILQPSSAELKKNSIKEVKRSVEAKKDEERKEYFASDLKIPEPKGADKNPAPKIAAPEPLGFTRLDSVNSLENRIWEDNDSFFSQNAEISVDYPEMRSSSGEIYQITKSGLNFRQVNIVEEERQQITKLKAKMKSLLNQTSKALKIK